MKTSRTIHSFLLSQQKGQTLLTAQEYPWSVLQVIFLSREERLPFLLTEQEGMNRS